jgi:hypothetical protein
MVRIPPGIIRFRIVAPQGWDEDMLHCQPLFKGFAQIPRSPGGGRHGNVA